MKKVVIIIVIILVVIGLWFLLQGSSVNIDNTTEEQDAGVDVRDLGEEESPDEQAFEGESVIGTSVGGNQIVAHRYGTGEKKLLFVGGIHGGYSWNTTLVARELMDYLEESPEVVPENVTVTVIPVMNPDGLEEIVGTTGSFTAADAPSSQDDAIPGRFNGNGVDLNRNFDCDWQEEGVWQNRTVDAGGEVFSEPESRAVRDFIESYEPDGVVVWYSAVGGVFASSCHNGVLGETLALTNAYADASGYSAFEEYDFYEITGDMANWLAKEGVPTISVLLTTHQDTEWDKNKAGIEALFDHFEG